MKIREGDFTAEKAAEVAEMLFYKNPKRIFQLP
jgi:hypothetical protein